MLYVTQYMQKKTLKIPVKFIQNDQNSNRFFHPGEFDVTSFTEILKLILNPH